MPKKEKKVAVRFIEKQLELAGLELVRLQDEYLSNPENEPREKFYGAGRIEGQEEVIRVLTHLIENCAE